jgi:hypothetical protein
LTSSSHVGGDEEGIDSITNIEVGGMINAPPLSNS